MLVEEHNPNSISVSANVFTRLKGTECSEGKHRKDLLHFRLWP